MKGLQLLATGGALPSRVVTNEDLRRQVDTSDEWIVSRSDSLSTQLNAHLDEKLSVTIYVTNQETSQQTGSDYGDSDYAEEATVVDVPQQPAQPAQEPTTPAYAEGDSAYEDDDYEDGDSGYEADDD